MRLMQSRRDDLLTGLFRQAEGWQLQFSGPAGRSYGVETSTNPNSWDKSGTATEYAPGLFQFADGNETARRDYGVVARGVPRF
jgi:hypothetical protein